MIIAQMSPPPQEVSVAAVTAFIGLLLSIIGVGLSLYSVVSRDTQIKIAVANKIQEITTKVDSIVDEKVQHRLAEIEAKMDIIWGLLIQNGLGAGLRLGLLEKKSPLRWSLQALKENEELISSICTWYAENGVNLKDIELLVALEKQFDQDILKLSKRYEYQHMAVVIAILFLCRPDSAIFQKYQTDDWNAT